MSGLRHKNTTTTETVLPQVKAQMLTTACTLTCASSTRCRKGNADTIASGFSKAFRITAGSRAKDAKNIVDLPGTKAA